MNINNYDKEGNNIKDPKEGTFPDEEGDDVEGWKLVTTKVDNFGNINNVYEKIVVEETKVEDIKDNNSETPTKEEVETSSKEVKVESPQAQTSNIVTKQGSSKTVTQPQSTKNEQVSTPKTGSEVTGLSAVFASVISALGFGFLKRNKNQKD